MLYASQTCTPTYVHLQALAGLSTLRARRRGRTAVRRDSQDAARPDVPVRAHLHLLSASALQLSIMLSRSSQSHARARSPKALPGVIIDVRRLSHARTRYASAGLAGFGDLTSRPAQRIASTLRPAVTPLSSRRRPLRSADNSDPGRPPTLGTFAIHNRRCSRVAPPWCLTGFTARPALILESSQRPLASYLASSRRFHR